MKYLSTVTAVAALVVGMSIASAQAPSGMQNQSPSNSGAAKDSSAKPVKQAVKGNDPFCIVNKIGGQMNCKYASLDACQKDPKLNGRQCVAKPGAGTSGAK